MSKLAYLIGTWFYSGHVPKGPGTAGSAGAILVAWMFIEFAGFTPLGVGILGLLFIPIAIWASDRIAKESGMKDPQIVVADEVAGQWITFLGAGVLGASWSPVVWITAFILFRIFDITKPPPVRALEQLPGGTGIVMDDVGAGLYAALVLFAAGWFNLY
jgi:phosphatidylglycerophosphatase A